MKQPIALFVPTALALALSFASTVHAAGEPRVMFVSKTDMQPVLIDLQGKQLPAQKGAVIPPGFTVMVPEGATVQIMTPEKGILAVRPNSLLRLDGIAGTAEPYKLTLNRGGVRVANPELNFRKFEISTPNAQVNFGKGDHETFFLMPGKLKDGRWGTFARGSNDDTVVKTQTGDLKLLPREIGHVPGGDKGKPTIITLNEGGKQPQNPVSYTPGAREIATTQMTENFQSMSDPAKGGTDPAARGADPATRSIAPKTSDPIPGIATYKASPDLKFPVAVNTPAINKPLPRIDPAIANPSVIDPSKAKKETQTVLTPMRNVASVNQLTVTIGSADPAKPPSTINLSNVNLSNSKSPAPPSTFSSTPASSLGSTTRNLTNPNLTRILELPAATAACKGTC